MSNTEKKVEKGDGVDSSTPLINIDITREELGALQYLNNKARVRAELRKDVGEVSRLKTRAIELVRVAEAKGCPEVFDHKTYLGDKSDDQILEMLAKVKQDLLIASEADNNSERHQDCFAAAIMISQEADSRGLL